MATDGSTRSQQFDPIGGAARRSARVLVALVLAWGCTSARAAESAADQLASALVQIKHLTARFTQTVVGAHGELVQAAEGTVHVARPKQFKWVLREPYAQTIVTVGDRLYVYDPDLQQIQVKRLDQALAGTPALVLLGTADDIAAQFDVARIDAEGHQQFTLAPKSADAVYTQIRMTFAAQRLLKIEIVDSLGQITDVDFRDLEINGPQTPDEFQFDVPPGTDIIGDVAPKPA